MRKPAPWRAALNLGLILGMTLALTGPAGAARSPRLSEPARFAGAQRFAGGWAVPSIVEPDMLEFKKHEAKFVLHVEKNTVWQRFNEDRFSPGIRPGQWLITVTADKHGIGFAWCTANFVFVKNGTYGLGTAGHCAGALGNPVTAYVVPPPGSGKLPGIYAIGRFSLVRNNGIGDDFAMVTIDPQYNAWVNPTMPVWGGPQGVYRSDLPTVVKHFGHGVVIGTGGTPRAGLAPIWTARGGTAYAWYGASTPGDSGSGVEAVGAAGPDLAAGDLTHIVILDCNPRLSGRRKASAGGCPGEILPGMIAGTRMTKILQIANGWTLAQGSLVPL